MHIGGTRFKRGRLDMIQGAGNNSYAVGQYNEEAAIDFYTQQAQAYGDGLINFFSGNNALQTPVWQTCGDQQTPYTATFSIDKVDENFFSLNSNVEASVYANGTKVGALIFHSGDNSFYVNVMINLGDEDGYFNVGRAMDELIFKASILYGFEGRTTKIAVDNSSGFHFKCGLRPTPDTDLTCAKDYIYDQNNTPLSEYKDLIKKLRHYANKHQQANIEDIVNHPNLQQLIALVKQKEGIANIETIDELCQVLFVSRTAAISEGLRNEKRPNLHKYGGDMFMPPEQIDIKKQQFNIDDNVVAELAVRGHTSRQVFLEQQNLMNTLPANLHDIHHFIQVGKQFLAQYKSQTLETSTNSFYQKKAVETIAFYQSQLTSTMWQLSKHDNSQSTAVQLIARQNCFNLALSAQNSLSQIAHKIGQLVEPKSELSVQNSANNDYSISTVRAK